MMKIINDSKEVILKETENYFLKIISKIETSFSSLN